MLLKFADSINAAGVNPRSGLMLSAAGVCTSAAGICTISQMLGVSAAYCSVWFLSVLTECVCVMLSPSVCYTAFVVTLKWYCSGAGVVCQGRSARQRCYACLHSAGALGLLLV